MTVFKRFAAATACVALATLTACGSNGTDTDAKGEAAPKASTPAKAATPEIVDHGFGQNGEYVQAIVVVRNSDAASVGEFATVSVNFLDEAGELLATETQVESFTWETQDLVLPVWLDLSDNPKANVASIEPTVSISDHGSSADPVKPLPAVDASTVSKGEYSEVTAKFTLANTTDAPLEDLRVGVVCYDTENKIIGGGSEYPDMIPANGKILLESSPTATGVPAKCTAFPNYSL